MQVIFWPLFIEGIDSTNNTIRTQKANDVIFLKKIEHLDIGHHVIGAVNEIIQCHGIHLQHYGP